MKQESTFYTRELTALTRDAWKTRAKSIAVARQEYLTDISEEYEYSHEKAERVSLSQKNARIQFIQNISKQKHTDAPSKALKMWLN